MIYQLAAAIWRKNLAKLFTWAPKHINVSHSASHFGRLDDYLSGSQLKAINSRLAEAGRR